MISWGCLANCMPFIFSWKARDIIKGSLCVPGSWLLQKRSLGNVSQNISESIFVSKYWHIQRCIGEDNGTHSEFMISEAVVKRRCASGLVVVKEMHAYVYINNAVPESKRSIGGQIIINNSPKERNKFKHDWGTNVLIRESKHSLDDLHAGYRHNMADVKSSSLTGCIC